MKNSEAVLITGRISREDTDELDSFCQYHGISRSRAVAEAVLFYKDTRECIMCRELNNPKGKYCSVCGTKLYTDKDILEMAEKWDFSDCANLSNFKDEDRKMLQEYVDEGFEIVTKLVISRVSPVEPLFQVQILLKTQNGSIVSPRKPVYVGKKPEYILGLIKETESLKDPASGIPYTTVGDLSKEYREG